MRFANKLSVVAGLENSLIKNVQHLAQNSRHFNHKKSSQQDYVWLF